MCDGVVKNNKFWWYNHDKLLDQFAYLGKAKNQSKMSNVLDSV